jgi:hypothetical protein
MATAPEDLIRGLFGLLRVFSEAVKSSEQVPDVLILPEDYTWLFTAFGMEPLEDHGFEDTICWGCFEGIELYTKTSKVPSCRKIK